MTTKRIASLTALLLVAALVLGLGVGPALAAKKVMEIKDRGVTAHFFDPEANICGAVALMVEVAIHQFTLTLWDNGHGRLTASAALNGFDLDGVHRARDHITLGGTIGPGGLPQTFHFTSTGVCTAESGEPGFEWHATFGFTVNEQGELTSLRLLVHGDPPGPD